MAWTTKQILYYRPASDLTIIVGEGGVPDAVLKTGRGIAYREDASSSDGFMFITVDGGANYSAVDAGAVDLNLLTAGVLDPAADSVVFIDADDGDASKKETVADFVGAIAGEGLSAGSGQLSPRIGRLDLTIQYTDLTANAQSEEIAFASALPSRAVVLGTFVDITTLFNSAGGGGDPTQAEIDVGLNGGDTDRYVDGNDIWTGTGATGINDAAPGVAFDGTVSAVYDGGSTPSATVTVGGGETVGDGAGSSKFTAGELTVTVLYMRASS